MANPHSSVRYVEPNYTFSGLTAAANDGETYDRAPDLEDYCIALDIMVELSSRHKSISQDMSEDNKVVVMSYVNDNGEKGKVRFMSGTKIGGFEKDSSGEFHPKLSGNNVLTTYYADMYVTDLIDYGTTEMLGIKSVEIDYNSTCVPIIRVRFTDVRGMSIFQPSELNDDKSFNGIRGLSKDNIAQTFFQSFFTLPPPKFTVTLKGFYGKPVSYQVMCNKFETSFDSVNGYFDVDTAFIGYAYSYMSDVSFNALLAAPYSDYKGQEYWDSQVAEGRFKIPDKNGQPVDMPKLYDIRKTIETLLPESDENVLVTSEEGEDATHEIEIQELTKLRTMYTSWYESLYNTCCNKYGKDYCYRYGGTKEDEDYERVIILTNGENISGNDLSGAYLEFNEEFRNMTGKLMDGVDEFNASTKSYRKMPNIKDNFAYTKMKVFRNIWINDKTRLLMFDGFHSDCSLPKKQTIDVVFGSTTDSQQASLKKIYGDGKYQYIDAFVIDLDYTDIKRRINALIKDAENKKNDEIKKRKAINRHMYEKIGWYPTIENFTKVVMAHLETLMAMMYDVIEGTKGRTVSSLGVGRGDSGVVDISQYDDNVAPFPRLTILTTDEDGYTKSEDTWAGNFKDGEGFREVDMVNGLLNGAAKISQLELEILRTQSNINQESGSNGGEQKKSVIMLPITSHDYLLTSTPYGDDVMNDINTFAGKVSFRMFDILCLNYFRAEKRDSWVSLAEKLGTIEACNFNNLHKITNIEIMNAIGENGTMKDGDGMLSVITGPSDKMPWGGDKPLFGGGSTFWLERYSDKKRGVYPVKAVTFKDVDDMAKNPKTPLESTDVVVLEPNSVAKKNYTTIMKKSGYHIIANTAQIDFNHKYIWEMYNTARSVGGEEYGQVIDLLGESIIADVTSIPTDFISSDNTSFNNRVDSAKLLAIKDNGEIPMVDGSDTMYAGDDKYSNRYEFNNASYTSEMVDGAINSYTITECFGFAYDDGYVIDKSVSLFETSEINGFDGSKLGAFFIFGIDSLNYVTVKNSLTNHSYSYVPNIAALQIGAAIKYFYGDPKKNFYDAFSFPDESIPMPDGFEVLNDTITQMAPYVKIAFSKHFNDWAYGNKWRLNMLKVKYNEDKGCYISTNKQYEKSFEDGRLLFNQESSNIKKLTNSLFSLVCISRLNINACDIVRGQDGKNNDMMKRMTFRVDEGVVKTYLDAFLKKLRELNGVASSEDGDPTTLAKNPSQVSDDMKIELYRYLKQLYDKWASTTKKETWNFDNFFGEKQKNNPVGNNFFFIDSFYNKVGNKLLINPKKISEMLKLTVSSMDTNVMMYNFLAQVYGHHRCMMKCVQNFKSLSEGISDLFTPVPYNLMGEPRILSDFVVVYTYESSKNIGTANGEYKDDGFMLNDEFDTPLPIKSRGDDDKSYKIPAFGVSYGRQYQHYFKAVNVSMEHPAMTEQAIIAKHNILAASRNKSFKNTQAQDLYDIYSNQSYTCTLDMMGCAYVQPLMYFVLLNVPFFKGSYLISKVKHSIKPGEMSTQVTGVRMSKYCNRLVEDMFTDQMDETIEPGEYNEDRRYENADTCNDCGYKTFPIGEDSSNNITMSKDEMENANSLMRKLIGLGVPEKSAAGIVGNMAIETGPTENNPYRFNPQTLNPNDSGFVAAGLCQWNDSYYGLQQMLKNDSQTYGHNDDKKYTWHYTPNKAKEVRKLLAKTNADYQCKFIVDSLKNNNYAKEKKLWAKLTGATSPRDAAHIFCNGKAKYAGYENPNPKYAFLSDRMDWADKVYNNYKQTPIEPSKDPSPEKKVNDPTEYTKMFFNSIQKSINATASYKCELKGDFKGESVKITTNGGGDKLAVLFDIILNSEDYYVHVKRMEWLINNAPSEAPRALRVVVAEKVQSRVILIGSGNSKNGNYDSTSKFNGDECNEKLMQSLSKKYGSDLNLFKKECPQFSNVKDDVFNKYKPNSCGSLTSGGSDAPTGTGAKITEGGIVGGNFNAKQAANWLVCATQGLGSQGICAFAVQQAVIAGGIHVITGVGGGYKQAKAMYESGKWDLLETGPVDSKEINFKHELQVGDIVGMTKSDNLGAYGHIAMYCGSKVRWVSDYQQGNPYVYTYDKNGRKRNPGTYWLIRYHGGEKSVAPKPGRCYNGKCLRNCSV